MAIIALLIMILSSCESYRSMDDVPAVIDNPTPASHGELVAVVSKALDQMPVMLSHSALTRTSILVIERRKIQNLDGGRDGRRLTDTAEQFRLVLNHSNCVLIHARDQSRFKLNKTTCRELD